MTGTPSPRAPADQRARQRAWRAEVLALRGRHRGRYFPATLAVGVPEGVRRVVGIDAGGDHGLRIDLVAGLLLRGGSRAAGAPAPAAWLTRPGQPVWHDLDARWLPAALHAFAEAGLEPDFVVLTKSGWYDPRTGAGQSWKRLRHRSG